MKPCTIKGCARKHYARGWCRIHHDRWLRQGDPLVNLRWKGGITKHPMYRAWAGMINRCTNPNHSSYHRYGGAGITVCERWRDFRNFLEDMGERPKGRTLDRVDPYGSYSPENCRWATVKEQRANIRAEGDKRMREAMSHGVKDRWAKWRAAGNVAKPKHPPQPRSHHDKACEFCGKQFGAVRSDARYCSIKCGELVRRPSRYSPDYLRKAAEALE